MKHLKILSFILLFFSCVETTKKDTVEASAIETDLKLAWLPLTLSENYLAKVSEAIPHYGVSDMVLSHRLGHVLESHLNYPERVEITQPLLATWKAKGVSRIWAWSHELSGLPENQVPASIEDINWEEIEQFLTNKYQRFFALLPKVDGIVLIVNETQVNLMRGFPRDIAQPNMERLVNLVHGICLKEGKRLALATYCDRASELEMIASIIENIPNDIIIINKHVPHDYHAPFPSNPLIASSQGKEQWISFDLGLQFELQNTVPVADVERLLSDMKHAYSYGARMFSARLDRYDGEKGQSSLTTPWGRLSLLTMKEFMNNPDVTVEEIVAQWEENEGIPNAGKLLANCTQFVHHLMYPCGQYGSKHSRMPLVSKLPDIIAGRMRNEPVSGWTGKQKDIDFEQAMLTGDPKILSALEKEIAFLDSTLAKINELEYLVKGNPDWEQGLQRLRTLYPVFRDYHRFFYHYLVAKGEQGDITPEVLKGSLNTFLSSLQKVTDWTHETGFHTSGKSYEIRHSKSSPSFEALEADARQAVQELLQN